MATEPLTDEEIEGYRWQIEHLSDEGISATMVARLLVTIDSLRAELRATERQLSDADWEARGESA